MSDEYKIISKGAGLDLPTQSPFIGVNQNGFRENLFAMEAESFEQAGKAFANNQKKTEAIIKTADTTEEIKTLLEDEVRDRKKADEQTLSTAKIWNRKNFIVAVLSAVFCFGSLAISAYPIIAKLFSIIAKSLST